jgi:hypothetical protein
VPLGIGRTRRNLEKISGLGKPSEHSMERDADDLEKVVL